MSAEESDLSLVQRAQRGESGAFDALVRRYQHKVVKLVMRYVRNPTEAEDIAQDAFIKAYRALSRFRGDSAFYTWLYRIAINTAKNSLAARARNPVQLDSSGSGDEDRPGLEERMSDTATPEALALTEEIRATVSAAIDRLPEDLRTAIMLRELEGLSYEEIAKTMDCPVGTVRSRIFRAREAVDERLREIFDGGLGRGEVIGWAGTNATASCRPCMTASFRRPSANCWRVVWPAMKACGASGRGTRSSVLRSAANRWQVRQAAVDATVSPSASPLRSPGRITLPQGLFPRPMNPMPRPPRSPPEARGCRAGPCP